MPRSDQVQLSPDICGSKVILFLGAGASAPLELKLMGSFMDLLEATLPAKLVPVLQNMYQGPGSSKDLEIVFEAIEQYHQMQSYCSVEPNWENAVGGRIAKISELVQTADRIKEYAENLVVRHYSEVDPEKVVPLYNDFLGLLAASNSDSFLPIFTTNYDTAIEDFVDNTSETFRLVDGFSSGSRRYWTPETTFHSYRAHSTDGNTLLLFKLHGSSTWYRRKDTREIVKVGSMSLRLSEDPDYENVLVWPARTKDLPDVPHEINYSYLKECLSTAQLCVVIGFSFRDEVIRRYFAESLQTNPTLSLAIIDPDAEAIINKGLKPPRGLRVRILESKLRKIKAQVVYGIPARFGGEGLPIIASALSKLDFPWPSDRLAALAAPLEESPTANQHGSRKT